jgi:multiple antibiotic resistance protein
VLVFVALLRVLGLLGRVVMLDIAEYVKTFIGLLAIVDPLGVSVALLVVLFFGDLVLSMFGISINSFQVGGGILVLLMAIAMLQAHTSVGPCAFC